MILKTQLFGHAYAFSSVKEVLAKANEEKSGDQLAGIAAENAAQALDAALAALKPGEALVVAGSLYLASELRPQLMRFKGKSEN